MPGGDVPESRQPVDEFATIRIGQHHTIVLDPDIGVRMECRVVQRVDEVRDVAVPKGGVGRGRGA